MKKYKDISPYFISWIKTNREAFVSSNAKIQNLYYPETIDELVQLVRTFYAHKEKFIIVGYSSNTLFLPSFNIENVICTKFVNKWYECDNLIKCECGVNVMLLSKQMINNGIVGFEGLTDLPGTLGAALYGNCGCRGCLVGNIVEKFILLTPSGNIKTLAFDSLAPTYRSTSLKRKEIEGVILYIYLRKIKGDVKQLKIISEHNHKIRTLTQPTAANNLGTTFNGGNYPTLKGWLCIFIEKVFRLITQNDDKKKSYIFLLKFLGQKRFIPYIYYWNRYMFTDNYSHTLFQPYYNFLKSLYKDVRLEIEIRH